MSRGGKAREDDLLCQEQRAGADREQRALAAGVVLLELRIGSDEAERFALLLQDLLAVSAEDDDDVKIVEALVSLFPRALRANEDALVREHLGFAACDRDVESLGSCSPSTS